MSSEVDRGETFADIIADSNGLPVALVLDVAEQVGDYLQSLHSQGHVHVALSPASILVDQEGHVHVLDVENDTLPEHYQPPEVQAGGDWTPQADCHALGVMLYHALTGETPSGPEDIWPGNRRPGLPPELDALVAKCLHPDPSQRIQSAAELLNGLEDVHRGIQAGAQDTVLGMEASLVGHTMGPYQLVERLGQGGMATVYKAYEPSLDRHVAVKILPQFMARDPQFMDRFRREAKAVAQLSHPNIVPIHSFGEQDGLPYIAMRYVEGETLKHARDGACAPEEAIRLLLPVLEALDYAHQEGIIHRDIKPSNVLMADGDWPLLADFGLAKMVKGSTQITATGVGVGTPAYMSPEQGQGTGVDQRTDIYSLGIVLYEMLTGDVPFRADTPMAVVIKHITAPLPMPREVNPAIPEPLERVILKATAKNPANRYQSAQAFMQALEAILQALEAGELEVVEVQEPVRERTERPSFQWKPVYWLGVIGLLLLLVSGVVFGSGMWTSPQATPTPSQEAVAVVDNTSTPTLTSSPTEPLTSTPTSTIEPSSTPTPTPIPLAWKRLNSAQFITRDLVTAIVIDPTDSGVWYAGTEGAGIYKSINGGVSWLPIQNGLGQAKIDSLAIDHDDSQILYAGTLMGVYKTVDGGQSWQHANRGISGSASHEADLVMDPRDSQHLFYTDGGNIYETDDGAESWDMLSNQLVIGDCGAPQQVRFSPIDSQTLFALSGAPHDFGCSGVFKSTDGGETWTPTEVEVLGVYLENLWIDNITGNYLYTSSGSKSESYYSSDGGETWQETSTWGCGQMVFHPENGSEAYCLMAYGKIQKTNNGGQSWQDIGKVVSLESSGAIAISPHDPSMILAGVNGLYLSIDGGYAWEERSNGLGASHLKLLADPLRDSTFYLDNRVAGGPDSSLYRTSDGGVNWELIEDQGTGLTIDATGQVLYRILGYDTNRGVKGVIMISHDGGDTWDKSSYLPSNVIAIFDVRADPNVSGKLYVQVMSSEGDPNQEYYSTDGGETWEKKGAGIGRQYDSEQYIRTDDQGRLFAILAVDPQNSDLMYAATDSGAYVSFDGGETWSPINDGLLGGLVIYSIVVDEESNVYAATPLGIFELEQQ